MADLNTCPRPWCWLFSYRAVPQSMNLSDFDHSFHCSALTVNDLVQGILFLLGAPYASPCSFFLTVGFYYCFRHLLALSSTPQHCRIDSIEIFSYVSRLKQSMGMVGLYFAFSVHYSRNWAKFFLHRRGSFSKEYRINHYVLPVLWGSGIMCCDPHQNTPCGSAGCVLSVQQQWTGWLWLKNRRGLEENRDQNGKGLGLLCSSSSCGPQQHQFTQFYIAVKEKRTAQSPLSLLPSTHHCQKLILGENRGKNANFQIGMRGKKCHGLWGIYFHFCGLWNAITYRMMCLLLWAEPSLSC